MLFRSQVTFPLNISTHFAPRQKNSHPIKAAKQSIDIFKNGRRAQISNSDIKVERRKILFHKKDSVTRRRSTAILDFAGAS